MPRKGLCSAVSIQRDSWIVYIVSQKLIRPLSGANIVYYHHRRIMDGINEENAGDYIKTYSTLLAQIEKV